jgi:hypothetical protein
MKLNHPMLPDTTLDELERSVNRYIKLGEGPRTIWSTYRVQSLIDKIKEQEAAIKVLQDIIGKTR